MWVRLTEWTAVDTVFRRRGDGKWCINIISKGPYGINDPMGNPASKVFLAFPEVNKWLV